MLADYQVQRGRKAKLDRIDGELKVGNKATIEATNGKLVIVSQRAYFEGAALVNCDFECDSLRVEHGGMLKVKGDLTVHKLLDVTHSIDVSGLIRAGEIDVGGKIYSKAIECEGRITVGGFLDVKQTLAAKSVDVGGTAEAGEAKLQDLNVGGFARVAGGSILGKIRVGGKFESKSPLEFGDMEVIGTISVPAHSKGKRISTYGRLLVSGDLDCDELEVRGRMDISGDCRSQRIEAGGKLTIGGSLEVAGEFETWGTTKIAKQVKSADLRIAGKFAAQRILVNNEIELAGDIESLEGMKGDVIIVRSGSKCRGALVGSEKVDVGRSYDVISNWSKKSAGQSLVLRLVGKETRVEDIYAKEVHLGRASRCRRVFGEVVEFEEGCVAEEINYTKEVRGPIEKVFLNRPFPKKVEQLPNPPL
jgi:cytoskeletal protein CcmA (bactofilin family)